MRRESIGSVSYKPGRSSLARAASVAKIERLRGESFDEFRGSFQGGKRPDSNLIWG